MLMKYYDDLNPDKENNAKKKHKKINDFNVLTLRKKVQS